MATNLAKERCLAQFNKTSGAFICFLSYVDPATLNQVYYEYVEMEVDPERQTVRGKIDDYKVVTIAEEPTRIYERVLRGKCQNKILKEYALDNQLDIIRSVVQEIAEQLASKYKGFAPVDLEALQEMNAYIDEVKASHKKIVESYKRRRDYEFISIEQEQREIEEQMEGGLHELAYGPRPVNV